MKKILGVFKCVKIGLAMALAVASAGCAGGYVEADGGYVGGGAVVVDPDVSFYGGWGHGHDVHAFRDRGFASRGIAHGGGRIGKR
jgi:hypothetical protein